jgi:CheY-like chemotaxis protein
MHRGPVLCFLIDDDTEDQEIFALALESLPATIRCVTANNGVDALEMLSRDQGFVPDYIFLDLNMPRMGGKQCLVELRKIERLQATPVIIFSTSDAPSDRHETRQLGATDFLTKPSSVRQLSDILGRIFLSGKPVEK